MLTDVNQQLVAMKDELNECYVLASALHHERAEEIVFHELLSHVNEIRSRIYTLENRWRDSAVNESKKDEEGYALWDQEETTLAQLVMEYGALDYLFIVPPEMSSLKL